MFFHSPAILPALISGACCMVEAAAAEPAGTSWQPVQIKSMDDRTDVPEDRAQYTLALQPGGMAAVPADCYRGNGSWTSEAAGQLQFGLSRRTRAMLTVFAVRALFRRVRAGMQLHHEGRTPVTDHAGRRLDHRV